MNDDVALGADEDDVNILDGEGFEDDDAGNRVEGASRSPW